MKISPIAPGAGRQTTVNPNQGSSASPDALARAKAAAAGQDPATVQVQAPEQRTTADILKRIRMKTNVTPAGRDWAPEPEQVQAAAPVSADNSDPNVAIEPGTEASEEPKPLSPQFAALAKAKRAAQVKEAELKAWEERLKASEGEERLTPAQLKERLKAGALEFLLEQGVTYDQLTQEVIRDTEGGGPALNKVESGLRRELQELKTELDSYKKTQTDSQTQAEQRALSHMQREADQIIAADDTYQMIRDTGSNKEVSRLIQAIQKQEGETISVKDALEIIEADLLEEGLKVGRIAKVQSRLQPQQQIQAPPAQDGMRRQTMRTLSNRDTVSAVPDRRARAMAAALGRKL